MLEETSFRGVVIVNVLTERCQGYCGMIGQFEFTQLRAAEVQTSERATRETTCTDE